MPRIFLLIPFYLRSRIQKQAVNGNLRTKSNEIWELQRKVNRTHHETNCEVQRKFKDYPLFQARAPRMKCSTYLFKYAILSFVPERAPATEQNVSDYTNTPHVRFRAWLTLQHLWSDIVCTPNNILEFPSCIQNKCWEFIMNGKQIKTFDKII